MHHSISTTLDDFDYSRRPVWVSLPWGRPWSGDRKSRFGELDQATRRGEGSRTVCVRDRGTE